MALFNVKKMTYSKIASRVIPAYSKRRHWLPMRNSANSYATKNMKLSSRYHPDTAQNLGFQGNVAL